MRLLLLLCFLTVMQACKTDTQVQHALIGTWQVRASFPQKSEDQKSAPTPDAQKDTESETMNDADSSSEKLNEWRDVVNGLDQMVKGLEQMADGLAEIGMGIGAGIKDAISQNLSAKVTLNADSTLQLLTDNNVLEVDLGQENIRWWVKDGSFFIQNAEKDSAYHLSIVSVKGGGYDFQHEKIHLHLRKPE